MELTRIDEAERLYIVQAGAGYVSCIDFDHAFQQAMKIAEWLGGNCSPVHFKNIGTRKGFEEYEKAIVAGRLYHEATGEKCEANLDLRFAKFHESGERVEVNWKDGFEDYSGYGARTDGMKARFYVEKSSGWMPIYLMVYRKNSHGGGSICSSGIKSLHGLGIFNRR